jgi:hypothetical protein
MDGITVVGQTEVAVPAVLVRWVNLDDVGQGDWLEAVADDRTPQPWPGRQVWRLGKWTMTVDARPDLAAVIETLKETGKYAVTHLGTLQRIDQKPFTAKECEPVLTAYQFASSFVLGRFTCPALAEARDDAGRLVWREWGARLADPLGGVDAWWNATAAPIAEPVRLLGERLLDPTRGRVARHLAQSYVASNRGGFVEQRITIAFAALELLSWQRAVLEGRADPKKHQSKDADWRLRKMVEKAKIPISPIPAHLPALKAFAHDEGHGDAPKAVAEVRHRITHPKVLEDIYDRDQLLIEAWWLTVRYLELLILQWVGYTGRVVDRTKRGWPQVEAVPLAP